VVADAGPGVELVDGAAALADASPHRLPGRELFWEHVHPKPSGNYLLARALLPAVVRAMPPALRDSAAPGELLSQAECERRLGLTAHERRAVAAEVLKRLDRPPFTNQLNHAEQVRAAALETAVGSVDPARIADEYRWALEQNPGDRLLNLHYGLYLKRNDHPDAEIHLERARPSDGSPAPRDVYDH
jgi:hypothetical protein